MAVVPSKRSEDASLATHTIRGDISKVVYESEDGMCSVLRVVGANGKETTIVGAVHGAHEGQSIEATGFWKNHPEYGRQLKVESYKFSLPTSKEGIRKYLASGLIHGIGPKLAECIVDHFGADTLNVLDNFSARLLEVPGFGRKRLEMVRKAWREHARERDVFIHLQSLGLSLAYCRRVFKRFGLDAPRVVKENPYGLAETVDGIGFILADRVANALGIQGNDIRRLKAGIGHTLNKLAEEGHVCYPKEDFVKRAAELLGVSEDEALKGLDAAVAENTAAVDAFEDTFGRRSPEMVYSFRLFTAERELAVLVSRVANAPNHAGKGIGTEGLGSFLSDEQRSAVQSIAKHPLNVITGGPGVGKTTVVGEIVRRAKRAGLKVYLAAPTGRAAKRLSESCRMNAMTIHRTLKWEPEKRNFAYGTKRPLKCDLLIVDEVSMLDVPLALFLFRAISPGTTVAMVGDADQLPSVGPGKFLMDLILSKKAAVTHLSKIYRQAAHSRIITNAHAVNMGRLPDLSPVPREVSSDFYWMEEEDPGRILEKIAYMATRRIPERFGFDPMRDIQILTPMNRGTCGTKTLNELLQEKMNPGTAKKPSFSFGERRFRSGDRVMQIRNNYDKGVFNGDMGRLVRIDHAKKTFAVRFDIGLVEYDFIEADQIVLAYAITVHKSQGSEFPVVIFPVLTQHYIMLRRNLLYTGMTRAKKLLVMAGSRKALSLAVDNARIEPRFSLLKERLASI